MWNLVAPLLTAAADARLLLLLLLLLVLLLLLLLLRLRLRLLLLLLLLLLPYRICLTVQLQPSDEHPGPQKVPKAVLVDARHGVGLGSGCDVSGLEGCGLRASVFWGFGV